MNFKLFHVRPAPINYSSARNFLWPPVWLLVFAHLSAQTTLPPEMVFVEGGTFTMGCTPEQQPDCAGIELPTRLVRIQSFWIGKYEVSISQWDSIMPLTGSLNGTDPFRPVVISSYDAMTFCNRLSIREGLFPCYFFDEGYTIPLDTLINNYPTELPNIRVYFDPSASGYRLPIESEWEFAGRGGIYTKNYKYAGSNDPSLVNPFQSGGGQILPYPIGTKMPNELGLYDMCGNVPEWCSDLFEDYVTYPSCIYFLNSIRGGLIHNPIYSDLSVRRTYSFPQPIIFYLFGFRLARNAD